MCVVVYCFNLVKCICIFYKNFIQINNVLFYRWYSNYLLRINEISHHNTSWSLRWSNWALFSTIFALSVCNLLNGSLVRELLEHIVSLDFVSFFLTILVNEILNIHKSSSNSYKDFFTFFNFNVYSSLSELIYALWFTKEHNVHLFPFWVFINEVC